MPAKERKNDSVSSQRERFIEAARNTAADEDEAAFKAKLGVIAKQNPQKRAPKIESEE